MFFDEIYSQPDVMVETAQSVTAQIAGLSPLINDPKRIVFTGMGSSHSAVYPSVLRLIEGGVDARLIEASELLYYQANTLTSNTLLIVVSQSGRSAEVSPLIGLANRCGAHVLGITNTLDSVLHQHSQTSLVMKAGAEATVSTKTYTCTLVLLHLLTTWLLNQDVNESLNAITALCENIRPRLPQWHEQMTALAEQWTGTHFIEYLGRGYAMASATTAALISKESIKMPTEGMNAGQFRHGPIELVDGDFTGMFFIGGEPTLQVNRALASDIVNHGGRLALISQSDLQLAGTEWIAMPVCPAALLPFAEIIPIQLFCGEMSIRKGYEAGKFRYIGKVTEQE